MNKPSTADEFGQLRRRLDRAVKAAVCARVFGWLGCFACIAVMAVVIAAVFDLVLDPSAARAGRFVVVVALVLAAFATGWGFGGRFRRTSWPGRIDVARAAERVHPQLGERLSCAVDFLEDLPAGASADLTAALERLSVEKAAWEAARLKRLPWPGLRQNVPWAVAGTAAVAALIGSTLVLPRAWRDAVRRQVTFLSTATIERKPTGRDVRDVSHEGGTTHGVSAVTSEPVVSAANRLAAAAEVESRLAGIFSEMFARAPGVAAESLSADERRNLATLAGIQRDTIAAIRTARDMLSDCVEPSAKIADVLVVLDQTMSLGAASQDVASATIISNRLAIAAREAAHIALAVAAAASSLGKHEAVGGIDFATEPPRAGAEDRRTMAVLGEIERGLLPEASDVSAGATHDAAGVVAAGRLGQSLGEGRDASSSANREPGTSTTEPSFAVDDAVTLRPGADSVSPVGRFWSLVPESSRFFDAQASHAEVPVGYVPAVDLYYQLLLQSISEGDIELARPKR